MKNDAILEVWNGTIFLEAQIEEFHSHPEFKNSKELYNLFFVKYKKDIWSWKIFFEFTAEDNVKSFDHFNFMKEDILNTNPNPGTRYFNDASNDEQNNHTCSFTLLDKNVFDNRECSFVWRQNFGNWYGAYQGSLTKNNFQDIHKGWKEILLDGINFKEKKRNNIISENKEQNGLYTKEYLLGLSQRWGIEAEAGHLIEIGFKTIMPNGDGTYQVGFMELPEVDKEKIKFTKSVDKHFRNK